MLELFVEAEIKLWLTEARPNMMEPLEFYPKLAAKIAKAMSEYHKAMLNRWPGDDVPLRFPIKDQGDDVVIVQSIKIKDPGE